MLWSLKLSISSNMCQLWCNELTISLVYIVYCLIFSVPLIIQGFDSTLFFFFLFFSSLLLQYLEAKVLLFMRFCRNIIDCYTHSSSTALSINKEQVPHSLCLQFQSSLYVLIPFSLLLCHLLLFTFRSSLAGPCWISCPWALLAQCQ